MNNLRRWLLSFFWGVCLLHPSPELLADTVDTFNPGANGAVYALAVQGDGDILVGGAFTTLGGQSRPYLGRFNADGTLDAGFNPGANGVVYSLTVQEDGKILAAGVFTTLGGQSRSYLGRLNADGTLDTGFNPGANGSVYALVIQQDGKIVVGGAFTALGGQSRSRIGRLNSDGTLDTSFNPGASSEVFSLASQPDGKILAGGTFMTLGGQGRSRIGRLNADGALDTGFNPGASDSVATLAVQADGRILVGGSFTTLGGQSRSRIGRLNVDGTLDPGFNPGANGSVSTLAIQADGKVLVGGSFWTLGGQSRTRVGRLNVDGTLDASFNPGASSAVLSLAVQADGKVLVGGSFTTFGGQSRAYIGRLAPTQPAIQNLTLDGATVIWERSGSGPEVWRTVLDVTTNDVDWINLGAGTRVASGWQWSGVFLPNGVRLRARGFTAGGLYGGSGGLVESGLESPVIFVQPASQLVPVGETAVFSVTAVGSLPLSYQWWKDGGTISGATDANYTLANAQFSDAGIYSVVVSNAYGTVTSSNATLTLGTSLADAFNPGASGNVFSLVTQADGKILAGGAFITLGGQSRNRIGRFNTDGTLDMSFNPGASTTVFSLAVQADGKILVGGTLMMLGRQSRLNLGRLNADGTLDTDFNPGASGAVYSLAVQADGKILVGGNFTTLGGQSRPYIGRLNADGSLDPGFNPGASGAVYSMAVQADGKILVGGSFTGLGGQSRSNIGRLRADGSLDSGFNPGASGAVYSLAVQADGKILVGGSFTTLGGQSRSNIGRLNADGLLDSGFDPGASGTVYSLAVQTDGGILVGGVFTTLGGRSRSRIGRLNADGSLDMGFDPTATGNVNSLTVQADGKILVGGYFGVLGGQARANLGRLTATGSVIQRLITEDSTVIWQRSGSGPEVGRTVLEMTTNGVDWINAGAGTRVTGGWQWSGLTLPTNVTIRALGFPTGGFHNSSGGLVEAGSGPPVIVTPPMSQTVLMGSNATFSASVVGSQPMSYLWRKEGVPVSGATNASYTLTNVGTNDAGAYSVVASNAYGAIVSTAAVLALREPGELFDDFDPDIDLTQWSDFGGTVGTTVLATNYGGAVSGANSLWFGAAGSRHAASRSMNTTEGGEVSFWLRLGSNQSSKWEMTVLPANGIALEYSTNSGSSWALLTCYTNGSYSNWTRLTAEIPAAAQTTNTRFRWRQLSNNGVGFDHWALDDVEVSTAPRPPTILQHPASQTVGIGSAVSFSVTASGSSPLSYQWRKDSGDIGGATNSTLVLSFVQTSDAGVYSVVVSNAFGAVTSSNATLTVATSSTVDSFNPGVNGWVSSFAVQADGKIVVGGDFFSWFPWEYPAIHIRRVYADGTPDTAFIPWADNAVYALTAQADGKVLVGGDFTTLGGQSRNRIARINADGSLDVSFNPGADGRVTSLMILADGKIVVGGCFTTLGGQSRAYLGRLNRDGSLDAGFNPTANGCVNTLAGEVNGKIFVGGAFRGCCESQSVKS